MRSYEMVFIARPDLEEDALDEVMTWVEDLVGRHDGEIRKSEPWGLRRLAYPIKDHQEGRYVLMRLDLEPGSVRDLERALKLNESIIRHMVVRLES